MSDFNDREAAFIRAQRVAHLATAGADGRPHVVPICYAFDGERLYTAIDEKPKQVGAWQLRRVRNIEQNPNVAVVVDRYSDDWSRLAWVLVHGQAEILVEGEEHRRAVALLRDRYSQYRDMALEDRPVIRVTSTKVRSWGAL